MQATYSDSLVLVTSEAVGVLLLLLDDLALVQRLDCHLFIFNKESRSNLHLYIHSQPYLSYLVHSGVLGFWGFVAAAMVFP